MTEVDLICEGPCNGNHVLAMDAELRESRKHHKTASPSQLVRLRMFRHTGHEQMMGDWYRCGVCGTMRRYGDTVPIGVVRRYFTGARRDDAID